MSFKRLEPEDFLLSTDAIVAPAFAGGNSKNTAATVGNSGVSADYFTAVLGNDSKIEYHVAYGEKNSTTSDAANVVYRQFANIIEGNSEASLNVSTTKFTAIVVERARYKQAIFPASFEILTAIQGSPTGRVETGSADVTFGNAGRVYKNSGNSIYLYPDIGTILTTTNASVLATSAPSAESLQIDSEEVITSNYVFIRARNAEFNYSQNPTFIDSTTGGVRYTDFITAPQTFITTVGLYNDNGDLLAVAKLSKPLKKDFTKEALIRIKLDF